MEKERKNLSFSSFESCTHSSVPMPLSHHKSRASPDGHTVVKFVNLLSRVPGTVGTVGTTVPVPYSLDLFYRVFNFSDISFGMCLSLMSWVQQVHNAAVVAR